LAASGDLGGGRCVALTDHGASAVTRARTFCTRRQTGHCPSTQLSTSLGYCMVQPCLIHTPSLSK